MPTEPEIWVVVFVGVIGVANFLGQMFWLRPYFALSIPFARLHFDYHEEPRTLPTAATLARTQTPSATWPFVFKDFDPGVIAFRRSLREVVFRVALPYHGTVTVDRNRRQVQVVGYCNWEVMLTVLLLLAYLGQGWASAPSRIIVLITIVTVVTVSLHLYQRRRLAQILSRIRHDW